MLKNLKIKNAEWSHYLQHILLVWMNPKYHKQLHYAAQN